MSTDDAQQRIAVQQLGGTLLKLGSVDATAASLLTKLFEIIADEAGRSPRFAKALSKASVVEPSMVSGDKPSAVLPSTPPRKRPAPAKKVPRQPGKFDPFDVLKQAGEQALFEKLSELNVEQLRDIIAEQEIDTRKEAARKRSVGPIVVWTVDRVKALASKGSVFR